MADAQSPEEAQVALIKQLKTSKAPKEEVEAAVAELRRIREALGITKPEKEKKEDKAVESVGEVLKAVTLDELRPHFTSESAIANCPPGMTPEERFQLVYSVAEECIQPLELA